jgi:hypothetical protein
MRAVLALALAASLASTAAASTIRYATLHLASLRPLVVSGSQFRPLERVGVIVTSPDGRMTRRVVASRAGTFRVRFGDAQVSRCTVPMVRAVGSSGSVAILKPFPTVACMPVDGSARSPGEPSTSALPSQ